MTRFRELTFLPLLAVLPMGQLSGCNAEKNQYQPPPPPEVIVSAPLKQTVSDYFLETGTTEAVDTVELRARVSGILETTSFSPGQWILGEDDDPADYPSPPASMDGEVPPPIRVGQVVMTIEDEQYQADLASAKAALESANVSENRFQTEYNRQLDLQARNATTDYDVVLAKAQLDSAKAEVEAKKAAVNQAELTLSYCEIKATSKGRIGDQLVKPGNLVGDVEKTHLTTIVNYSPIYANFNINERAYLELRSNAEKRGKDIPVYLRLSNETKFEHQGQFEFADLDIDQSTGTYKLRAIFPNDELKIIPGLFIEVKVPLEDIPDALLLPESAVLADQTGKYVLVVDDQKTVQRKPVTVGPKQEHMVVISSGIEVNDRVVIQGLLRARPGAKVEPKQIEKALTLNAGADSKTNSETSN